jgi:hypothetical protein
MTETISETKRYSKARSVRTARVMEVLLIFFGVRREKTMKPARSAARPGNRPESLQQISEKSRKILRREKIYFRRI